MKKKGLILIFTFVFAILICSAVSAADNRNNTTVAKTVDTYKNLSVSTIFTASTMIDSGSKTFYGSKVHSYVTFHWDTYKINSNYIKMTGYYYFHKSRLKAPMTFYMKKINSNTLK